MNLNTCPPPLRHRSFEIGRWFLDFLRDHPDRMKELQAPIVRKGLIVTLPLHERGTLKTLDIRREKRDPAAYDFDRT